MSRRCRPCGLRFIAVLLSFRVETWGCRAQGVPGLFHYAVERILGCFFWGRVGGQGGGGDIPSLPAVL